MTSREGARRSCQALVATARLTLHSATLRECAWALAAQVDESMRVGPGGGLPNHGECIEVRHLAHPCRVRSGHTPASVLPRHRARTTCACA